MSTSTGYSAEPMLASTFSASPPTLNGSLSAAWIRWAAPATESLAWTLGSNIANSSPPRRATSSPSRSTVRRRLPTRSITRSPLKWPSESLISLNRSRSISNTATMPPGGQSARARSVIALNCSRPGSPVSPSTMPAGLAADRP